MFPLRPCALPDDIIGMEAPSDGITVARATPPP